MKLTIDIDEADAAKIANDYKSGGPAPVLRAGRVLMAIADAWQEQRPVQMGDRYRTLAARPAPPHRMADTQGGENSCILSSSLIH